MGNCCSSDSSGDVYNGAQGMQARPNYGNNGQQAMTYANGQGMQGGLGMNFSGPGQVAAWVNEQFVARNKTYLKLKRHHLRNTFDITDSQDQKIWTIKSEFFSMHDTRTVFDARTNQIIAVIQRSISPLSQLRHVYKCYAGGRGGRLLFQTEIDFELLRIGRSTMSLNFSNQAMGGRAAQLKFKDKFGVRHDPVTLGGITVADIKKSRLVVMGARSYDISVEAGMDMFLIIGVALIHDDIEERKRQAQQRAAGNVAA